MQSKYLMSKPFSYCLNHILVCTGVLLTSFAAAQGPVFQVNSLSGITDVFDIADYYGSGAAAADFDNDGDIDFYLCTISGIPDRLYRNKGNGQFENVAEQLGISITTSTRTALWFDYNGDSRLDLITVGERCLALKCERPILVSLFKQAEDGNFIDVTEESRIAFGAKYDNLETYAVGGIAAGDINNDGYLDLIITIWGGRVSLFQNNTNGTFSDISVLSGLGLKTKYYWQPMIHDFDGDGKMDIFCNVDFGKNEFWLNKGNSTFKDVASTIGADVDFNEMGMALGDYDNDGDLDIYATNITRTFQGIKQHNVLLKNNSLPGNLTFKESALALGVGNSGWDWGATFLDINNDGWLEIATTNGWNVDRNQVLDQSYLWLNVNGSFSNFSDQCQFNDKLSATTLLAFDADRDGDLDLLQTLKDNESTKMPALLYENKLEQVLNKGNYLVVKPRMQGPNHFSIGAIVRMKSGNLKGMRLISSGTSFYGQEPAEAFFGLGQRVVADEVQVEWPDGEISIYHAIEGNQVVRLDYEIVKTPSDLNAERTDTGVVLTWNDLSDNESGFILQRSTDRTFESFTAIEIDANNTSYFDELEIEAPRYYRIKAFNENVSSPYSGIASTELVTGISGEVSQLKIYPNPSHDRIFIHYDDEYRGEINISIADQTGRVVANKIYSKTEKIFTGEFHHELPSSLYFLTVETGKLVERLKVFVQRK